MLFDMSASSNSRKIMQLNPEYPKDVTMKSTDGTAVFKAEIAKNGRPDEYTYQWYVNGAAVAEANYEEYERDISGDKGQYTVWCEVTNKAGTVTSRRATLTVKKVPVLNASYPANTACTIGGSVSFSVIVAESGYPNKYSYEWYVNGIRYVEGSGKSSVAFTPSLVGTHTIYCVVTNEAGSVQSRTATFSVNRETIVSYGAFVDGGSWGSYCYNEDSRITQETWGLNIVGNGSGTNRVWSNQLYNLTGKNKLVFYCTQFGVMSTSHVGTFYFGATDDTEDGFIAYKAVTAGNYGESYITVDVSQISGWHRIKVCLIRNTYDQDYVHVRDVYFE